MTSESFCYWLQGFLEVSQAEKIDAKQVQIIKDHLNLVFSKKTPDYQKFNPLQQQGGISRLLKDTDVYCASTTELSC